MKLTGRFALCTALLLAGMPLRAQAPSILEPPVERLEGPPLWMSAEAVADEQKIIDLDRLDSLSLNRYVEKQRRELEGRVAAEKFKAGEKPSVAAIPLSECKRSLYSTDQEHRGGAASTATLSDLTENAQSILRGTIQSIDFGFDGGIPSSLLRVEVSEAIKGSAPASLFYILYPVARFRIGPFYFCNATNQEFEPRPGDEILIFDYIGPVDRDHVVLAPRFDQLFFQRQKDSLVLPRRLRSSPGMSSIRTLDDLISRLSLTTSSSPKPRRGAR